MTSLEHDLVARLSPQHGTDRARQMVRAFARSVGARGMRRLMEQRSLPDIETSITELGSRRQGLIKSPRPIG